MRFIDTRIHGMVDYLMGILLIAAPWLFGFANGGAAQWVPIFLGIGALLYSLMTDYELGLMKVISMKAHLMIDLLSGIFLAASPWIFGFSDEVFLPHLIFGIAEIGASLMTKQHPPYPETSWRKAFISSAFSSFKTAGKHNPEILEIVVLIFGSLPLMLVFLLAPPIAREQKEGATYVYRRPVEAKFSRDGKVLYIVEIGVIDMSFAGAGPFPSPVLVLVWSGGLQGKGKSSLARKFITYAAKRDGQYGSGNNRINLLNLIFIVFFVAL